MVDAAVLTGVGYRQGKRLWKRYREEGAKGLKHRSAGRRSNRALRSGAGGPAARPEDYRRRAPCAAKRDRIFRLESERVISDDWGVRYDGRFFQLEPQSRNYAPAGGQVVVGEWPEGRVDIEYRGRAVAWREILAPVRARAPEARPAVQPTPARMAALAKRKWVPPPDHPWRQAARCGAERRAIFVGQQR